MGTSITYKKKCEFCKKAFTAQKINTRFCSLQCASTSYKRNYRAKAKIEKEPQAPNKQNASVESELERIQKLEFLTVKQAGLLLSMSKLAIYRLIQQGKLPAVNLTMRNTRIHKKDILQLFEAQSGNKQLEIENEIEVENVQVRSTEKITRENAYSIGEILFKYGISNSALYSLIIKNKVPKVKEGKFTLVPKSIIDELLKDSKHA